MKVWVISKEVDAGNQYYSCDEVIKVVDCEEKAKKETIGKSYEMYGQTYEYKYEEFELE